MSQYKVGQNKNRETSPQMRSPGLKVSNSIGLSPNETNL